MAGYTTTEIAEAHRRWEQIKIGSARRFEQADIVRRLDEIRQDQMRGIAARRPGGLRDYRYDRAAMRAAQRLATERKRRDRRGAKHGRPAPRGVMQVHSGVGFMLAMPNFGRALEQLASSFQHLGVAAIAATDAFADVRERVALQQARGGWTADLVAEDEAFGNEPVLEQRDVGLCDGCESVDFPVKASDDGRAQFCPTCLPVANGTVVTRETLMDVMQREC